MLLRSSSTPGRRTLTFRLPADHPAGETSVVGNFNDWTPGALPMVPDAEGMKSATVELNSDYIAVFRYLGENDWWFDEPEADYMDAGASVVLGVEDDREQEPTVESEPQPEATAEVAPEPQPEAEPRPEAEPQPEPEIETAPRRPEVEEPMDAPDVTVPVPTPEMPEADPIPAAQPAAESAPEPEPLIEAKAGRLSAPSPAEHAIHQTEKQRRKAADRIAKAAEKARRKTEKLIEKARRADKKQAKRASER